MALELVWNKKPANFLSKELKRISKESYQRAESVESGILTKLTKAQKNPEMYPMDMLKRDNDGSYRAFETHSYRVAFRYTKSKIKVLRIRHVRREPKEH